ncbi:MAG: hypothetical protein U9O83_06085 [Campylobacterota bacterium]|nr:hypothetical protein [Campylobacterota bacterium]
MKFIILLFLFVNLIAEDDYSFRVAYGNVTSSDFGEILTGNIKSHPYDLRVFALDGGYLLTKDTYELPLDVYMKIGLSHFNEDAHQDDICEVAFYIKAYWNFDFLQNRVRVGLGEGLSYTSKILYTEYLEAQQKSDNNSKLLNYLDFSVDFDIGRLVRSKMLYDTSFGFAIKHRSGIYGLINDVTNGGSNYNTLYLEKNF